MRPDTEQTRPYGTRMSSLSRVAARGWWLCPVWPPLANRSRINDSIMELLIMISACKGGSAKSITGTGADRRLDYVF